MFYFMYYKYSGRREAIISAVHNEADHDYCPVCGGNFAIPREPVKFEMKGEPCDYYMSCGSIFISKRMHEFMQELGVTGYSVRSAEVIKWDKAKSKEDCENFTYYALNVTGRCGFMMDLNSDFLPKCDVCGRRFVLKEKVHGVKFADENYDGSDIFMFNNQRNVPIVTEALKKKLTKAKFTNLRFVELSQKEAW